MLSYQEPRISDVKYRYKIPRAQNTKVICSINYESKAGNRYPTPDIQKLNIATHMRGYHIYLVIEETEDSTINSVKIDRHLEVDLYIFCKTVKMEYPSKSAL